MLVHPYYDTYLVLLRPQIDTYRQQLHDYLQKEQAFTDEQADYLGNILFQLVQPKLFHLLQRTLILETNISRLRNELIGATPDARFRDFISRLDTDEKRAAILNEYSLITPLAENFLKQWYENSAIFLNRLRDDKKLICEQLDVPLPMGGALDIQAVHGSGDTHNQGKQVLVVQFKNGAKVVYKPRPMDVDRSLGEFVSWLNNKDLPLSLRVPKLHAKPTHGWVEFIATRPCHSQEEVAAHYRRLGEWLAVLYVLGGTDFHYENMIADGEHPIPIDTETLFHPRVPPDAPSHVGNKENADLVALEGFSDSLLMIGILPRPSRIGGGVVDPSGAGGGLSQPTMFTVPTIENAKSDEIEISRIREQTQAGQNRIKVEGNAVPVWDYANVTEDGFRTTYKILEASRSELLSASGPLAAFKDNEIRIIVRPTMAYVPLIIESFHPHLLSNSIERDKVFSPLTAASLRSPYLKAFIDSELNQIRNSDVPYFTTKVSSLDARGGDGTICKSVLTRHGYEVVEKRIRRLGEADLERQSWFIRTTFSAAAHVNKKKPKLRPVQPPAKPDGLLSAARQAGEQLLEHAFNTEHGASWLAFNFKADPANPKEGHYESGLVGTDLYDGLPGIILFLTYLGAELKDPKYTALAEKAFQTLTANRLDEPEHRSIGFFAGRSGLIYLRTQLAHLWNRPDLLTAAVADTLEIKTLLSGKSPLPLDVIAGLAGTIMGLLALYRVSKERDVLTTAIMAGDALLNLATADENYVHWRQSGFQLGFAHGTSGNVWALAALAKASGEKRFSDAAIKAAHWEQSLTAKGQWTDRQGDTPHEEEQATWCHGSPGIALSFSCVGAVDDVINNSLKLAIDKTFKSLAPMPSDGLCHGRIGNLNILLRLSQLRPELVSEDELKRETNELLTAIQKNGLRTSLPGHVFSPGLMTGIAGIGYGLLRLHAPNRVPCVLTMES